MGRKNEEIYYSSDVMEAGFNGDGKGMNEGLGESG